MPTLPIKQILKTSLSIFAVFAIVWIGVIAWWKHGNRVPSTRDITDYLVLMPSVIVIAYTLLGRMIGGIKQTIASPAGNAAPPTGASHDTPHADASPAVSGTPTRARSAAFRHAIMRSPLGGHAGLIKARLQQGKTAPLDATLLNLSGYPRRAARISDLTPEALTLARTQLSAANGTQTGAPTLALSDTALRTAALLFDVCHGALLHVHQACAASHAPPGDTPVRRQALAVELAAIVPGDWSAALTRQAVQALHAIHHAIATEQGGKTSVALQITTRHADASDAAYRSVAEAIDRLNGDTPLHRDTTTNGIGDASRPTVVIVAAAHSSIVDEPDSAIAAAGEAAVALIFGSAPYADPPEVAIDEPGFASGMSAQTIDTSHIADAGVATSAADRDTSDASSQQWDTLTNTTLRAAGVSADAMGAVFSDTGHTGPDAVRVSTLWTRTVAQLPAKGACLATDGACGAIGAAGALLSVALAAADTAAYDHPALAVTLSDRGDLAMLVTRPATAAFDTPDARLASGAVDTPPPGAAQTHAGAAESPETKHGAPPPDQSQPLAA